MGTSDGPAATIHPGAVRAIFDHLLLSLTVDGEPGPAAFVFSHYRFRWAADGIVGDLAFVEWLGRPLSSGVVAIGDVLLERP